MNNSLSGIELVILQVIIEYMSVAGKPPTQRQLWDETGSLVNNWIARSGIPMMIAQPIAGRRSVELSVDRLRELSLIEPAGAYTPTSQGLRLMETMSKDWHNWYA